MIPGKKAKPPPVNEGFKSSVAEQGEDNTMIRVRVRSATGVEGYIVHYYESGAVLVATVEGALFCYGDTAQLTVLRLEGADGYTIMTPHSEVSA